jgi:hypothetical protein
MLISNYLQILLLLLTIPIIITIPTIIQITTSISIIMKNLFPMTWIRHGLSAFRPFSQASNRCTCFDHASSRTAAWKRSPHTDQNWWTEMGGEKNAAKWLVNA